MTPPAALAPTATAGPVGLLAGPETCVRGELAVRDDERRVTVGGRTVRLTATGFDLLRLPGLDAGRAS